MAEKYFWLYIMASERNGTLYIGTTNNLAQRVNQHKDGTGAAFVEKYDVKRLVYFEPHEGYEAAREREIRLKKWRRTWKIALIEERNPDWHDLSDNLSA